ncbi:MAG: hypothetical protein WBG36_09905, partial [Ornithinimicrobium sp.]
MGPRRILALVLGVLLLIPAVALLTGGAALGSFYAFERGDDGYVERTLDPLEAQGVAVTAEDVAFTVDAGTPDWLVDMLDADVRLRVTGIEPDTPVFVGVGPQEQVDVYLSGVAHAEVVALDGTSPVYRGQQGTDVYRGQQGTD